MNGHVCFVAFYTIQQTPALPAEAPAGLEPVAPRMGPLAGSNAILMVCLVGSRAQTAPAGQAQREAIVACRQAVDRGGTLINRAG